MIKFLTPALLVINLGLTGAILGLAMTGKLLPPVPVVQKAAEKAPEKPKKSFYFNLKPEITVNFPGQNRPRYMQVALTLVTFDEAAIAAMESNLPVIRNDLLMLFSGLESDPLMTRKGKEDMRKQALETVRKIMLKRYGKEAVEDVYFTRFVMQ